ANNAIVIGSDGGALFDATTIETSIAANAAAIAADNDNSPTNEIQTLDLTGNRLSLSGATGFVDLPTADGSDTNINAGNNVTIQGNGTTATPYVINANNEIDGSVTNELQDLDFDPATNILTITNAATATNEVNLSALAGGGGTADGVISDVVYTPADNNLTFTGTGGGFNGVINLDDLDGGGTGTNQTAAEVPVTLAATNYTAATQDVEAHLAGIDAALIGGGGDDNQTAAEVPVTLAAANYTATTQDVEAHLVGIDAALASAGTAQNLSQVLATGTSAGNLQIADLANPTLDQDAATKAYVDATVASGGTLTDGSFLIGGTGDIAQQLVISGDATIDNVGVLTIEDEVIESANILDGTIGLTDLSNMGAITDGQILKWDTATTSWIVSNGSSHFGTENSIFFGDDVDGSPTDAGNAFFWDPNVREENGGNFGALGIGLDGGVMSTKVKVHVAEQLNGKLTYPIEMQNRTNQNNNNSAVGMLFSVDLDNAHGKGALSYERTGAWGVGDFHFLQNTVTTSTNPTLADKSFSILSNKDIQLYGNVIAQNGPGAVGQVLTTDASGQTVWGTGGGSGTDEQNIEGSVLTDQLLTIGIENGTGQDVDLASFATEVELAAAIAASAALDGDTDDQNEIELPTGGASGNVLSTDGAGVYSWIAASGGLAAVTTSTS
ncbi:beta strand repeat-containing protein, partial [Zobellia laminariae]|uniref:beta strand repeat-containing protein n=1 Tax=Zobellia laminariae TaxID=248906 RepID=UPI003EF34EAC